MNESANGKIKRMTKEERERIHRAQKKKNLKQKRKDNKGHQIGLLNYEFEASDLQDKPSILDQNIMDLQPEDPEELQKNAETNEGPKQIPHPNNVQIQNENPDRNLLEDQEEHMELDTEIPLTGKYYEEFKHVFQNFTQNIDKMLSKVSIEENELKKLSPEQMAELDKLKKERKDQRKKEKDERANRVSRKKRKQLRWLKVAQLKALVKRPDLVECWDITAPDPITLTYMKSLRNTVQVPKHWSQKRRFLQSKRGMTKQPFKLPQYIENTGISKLRDPFVQRDGQSMVRQKLKERMNPKLGKIDIDYEVLHDAFFKHQTKPKLTTHGDIYFEGKEEEVKSQMFKPGRLSPELRAALGISDFAPPPWLINMQRYGPPPSYPYLRVKGLNYSESLIQSGLLTKEQVEHASKYINQPGVYATFKTAEDEEEEENEPIDKKVWGEVVEEVEEIEEEDNDSMSNKSDTPGDTNQRGQQLPIFDDLHQKSGTTSVVDGLLTPSMDLRQMVQNRDSGLEYTYSATDRPLYQVLEQQKSENQQGKIFGGHQYVIPEQKK